MDRNLSFITMVNYATEKHQFKPAHSDLIVWISDCLVAKSPTQLKTGLISYPS